MKLVIAEKPSLARKIMEAFKAEGEVFKSFDGGEYYRSQHFIVTSQFGHLFELKDISDYPENEGRDMWATKNLPFFPQRYKFVLKEDVGKRFDTIKSLTNLEEVDEIFNCGDPDREGQLLVDLVIAMSRTEKLVTRPILKALTHEEIIKAIKERKPNSDYVNLRNEGLVRMYIDNDFGKNLSRYVNYETKSKPALNIGRVIGAIVTEIYQRDMAIKNFIPKKYFKVESEKNDIKLTSKKTFEEGQREEAEKYAADLNSQTFTVKTITKKEVEKQSPKLFSQTSLQAAMNKRFAFTPDKTLKAAQSLYEKGFTSYPRTNSEYMTKGEKETVKAIISKHGNGELKFKDTKKIFDDSKVEGHSAIIPTKSEPRALSPDEEKTYNVILNRFKAVFCAEKCLYDQTVAKIDGVLEEFSLKGESLKSQGWEKYENIERKEKVLPNLEKGMVIETAFEPADAQTSPPKPYTVETLGKWMQNPFKKDSDTEAEEYKKILSGLEIGTEATRATILKKAQDKEYIKLTKSTYSILPRGEYLVKVSQDMGIDMSKEKTAEMGRMTKAVLKGESSVDEVLTKVRGEITEVINRGKVSSGLLPRSYGFSANCPICGKPVKSNSKSYYCSGWREGCKFSIWKEFNGVALEESVITSLIKGEKTQVVRGFTSKEGNTFAARLVYNKEKNRTEFYFGKK